MIAMLPRYPTAVGTDASSTKSTTALDWTPLSSKTRRQSR
jgi:hypothetical protein